MYLPLVPTLSRRLWPQAHTLVRDGLLVLGGSLLIGLLAQLRIPLPFTPVPITGQTFGVLLVGASLGASRGAASLLLYLALGILGLPVFTNAGQGLSHLAGPTGGYLLGFIAAAYMTGLLAERGLERRWQTSLPAFLAGQALIYLFGVSWLALYTGPQAALALGLLPFLAGDAIKLVLAALALPTAWKFIK